MNVGRINDDGKMSVVRGEIPRSQTVYIYNLFN